MNDQFISPTSTRRAFLVSSGSILLLAGCGNLIGPSGTSQIYVLTPDLNVLPPGASVAWQLVVAKPEAPQSLNTDRIALMRGAILDYYADAVWNDVVPQLLQTTFVEAFEKSGRISAVAKDVAGIRADYILECEIRHFEARYDTQDGAPTVVVDFSVKLLSAQRREIVATREVRNEAKASANSIVAAVSAFDIAMAKTLDETVRWVLETGTPIRR